MVSELFAQIGSHLLAAAAAIFVDRRIHRRALRREAAGELVRCITELLDRPALDRREVLRLLDHRMYRMVLHSTEWIELQMFAHKSCLIHDGGGDLREILTSILRYAEEVAR